MPQATGQSLPWWQNTPARDVDLGVALQHLCVSHLMTQQA